MGENGRQGALAASCSQHTPQPESGQVLLGDAHQGDQATHQGPIVCSLYEKLALHWESINGERAFLRVNRLGHQTFSQFQIQSRKGKSLDMCFSREKGHPVSFLPVQCCTANTSLFSELKQISLGKGNIPQR